MSDKLQFGSENRLKQGLVSSNPEVCSSVVSSRYMDNNSSWKVSINVMSQMLSFCIFKARFYIISCYYHLQFI